MSKKPEQPVPLDRMATLTKRDRASIPKVILAFVILTFSMGIAEIGRRSLLPSRRVVLPERSPRVSGGHPDDHPQDPFARWAVILVAIVVSFALGGGVLLSIPLRVAQTPTADPGLWLKSDVPLNITMSIWRESLHVRFEVGKTPTEPAAIIYVKSLMNMHVSNASEANDATVADPLYIPQRAVAAGRTEYPGAPGGSGEEVYVLTLDSNGEGAFDLMYSPIHGQGMDDGENWPADQAPTSTYIKMRLPDLEVPDGGKLIFVVPKGIAHDMSPEVSNEQSAWTCTIGVSCPEEFSGEIDTGTLLGQLGRPIVRILLSITAVCGLLFLASAAYRYLRYREICQSKSSDAQGPAVTLDHLDARRSRDLILALITSFLGSIIFLIPALWITADVQSDLGRRFDILASMPKTIRESVPDNADPFTAIGALAAIIVAIVFVDVRLRWPTSSLELTEGEEFVSILRSRRVLIRVAWCMSSICWLLMFAAVFKLRAYPAFGTFEILALACLLALSANFVTTRREWVRVIMSLSMQRRDALISRSRLWLWSRPSRVAVFGLGTGCFLGAIGTVILFVDGWEIESTGAVELLLLSIGFNILPVVSVYAISSQVLKLVLDTSKRVRRGVWIAAWLLLDVFVLWVGIVTVVTGAALTRGVWGAGLQLLAPVAAIPYFVYIARKRYLLRQIRQSNRASARHSS